MIVNLWTTPRTGSNWYSQYLYNQLKEENPKTKLYSQYLNQFHFKNYILPGYGDFVYEYEESCSYLYYYFDGLSKSISSRRLRKQRTLNLEQEENYRLSLLEKHDSNRNPSIFYNHIDPVSDFSYKTLYNFADKNIFLYRKNIKNQMSSYALAYGTKQFRVTREMSSQVHVDRGVLENLANRIIKWHMLDKTKCEVLCYEDINFIEKQHLPKKQNTVDPFIQLDSETQNNILELESYCKNVVGKDSLLS